GKLPVAGDRLGQCSPAGARQIPDIGTDKPVSSIGRCGSVAQEKVEGIREWRILCGLVSRLIIQRLGPRVRGEDGETVAVPLVERNLQRIVRSIEPVEEPVDSGELLKRS